jgi:signal transduction histidine kinase
VEPELAIFLAVVAAALTVTLALSFTRERTLDRVAASLPEDLRADPPSGVRRLRDRLDAARFDARRAGEDLGQLVDLVEMGVLRLSDDRRVVAANRAAAMLLDRKPASLVGRTLLEIFVDHRIDAAVRAALQRATAHREMALGEDGARRVIVRARRAATGGVWLVMEDVTELRRLQRIRQEFIDNVSHELRTPLTTVRLLTETLAADLERVEVSPRIRDRVSKIDVETGHLVQMVNELLDLSRIESGGARLELDDVDMTTVITTALERLRPFADRQQVTLASRTSGPLPSVRGDEDRLGQLLINLLHNAVKSSRSGGHVTVAAASGADGVTVSVIDEGVGIPEADQARIFERFYKVDKARVRGAAGTGLGLAIARHIVESHGGWIRVKSREDHGSTFTFAIPHTGGAGSAVTIATGDPGATRRDGSDPPGTLRHVSEDRGEAAMSDRDEAERIASEQVGVGTAPGQPPGMGTGPRGHDLSLPTTGGMDAEAATLGSQPENVSGTAARGEPPVNVGGTQGTTLDQGPADEPSPAEAGDPDERPGFLGDEAVRRGGGSGRAAGSEL